MNQPSSTPNPPSESAVAAEQDLLASILSPEALYPWQPLDPAVEPYLARLEAEFDDLEEAEFGAAIAAGWQNLTAQMASQMATQMAAPALPETAVTAVVKQLRQFQGRMPGDLLQSLAGTATSLARGGQPLLDQLVQCATDILPTWDTADLAVLARPLAFSLRDGRGEILELNLRAIPANPWESLTELEQARLTLAIASVALKAAQADGNTTDTGATESGPTETGPTEPPQA
ncbi:MAG TPA: hypothetical protein VLS96_00985 [Nodosilinea sp.]|nr:hypothetical protein [Nodosilinea sp.]